MVEHTYPDMFNKNNFPFAEKTKQIENKITEHARISIPSVPELTEY